MNRYILFFISILLYSCKPSADRIVQKSIKAHQFSSFSLSDSIRYHKTTRVYDSLGQIKKVLDQDHLFRPAPFFYQIKSRDSSGLKILIQDSLGIRQIKNGLYLEDSLTYIAAKKSIETAYFVFWQVFKLDDPKAEFALKGKRQMESGEEVYAIELSYPSLDSTDEWLFFFDTKTYLNLGYEVRHNGRLSRISNDSFHRLDGYPLLVKERRSFFVDEKKAEQWLQADYRYELR